MEEPGEGNPSNVGDRNSGMRPDAVAAVDDGSVPPEDRLRFDRVAERPARSFGKLEMVPLELV
jgi:hypothetical protein